MRPVHVAYLVLVALVIPTAFAEDIPPRFDVAVNVSGGDVVLRVDVCGHGPGVVDLLGIDYGDPENLPIVLRDVTNAQACGGEGYRYRNVLPEGTLNPPLHCYSLDVTFTTATERLHERAYDCD